MRNNKIKEIIRPYLYILPSIILICVFVIYPIINNIRISFLDWSISVTTEPFIGFDNYLGIIKSKEFYRVLFNTFQWTILGVLLQMVIGLFLALLLDTKGFIPKVAQFLALIPWIIPGVITALMWKWMYQGDLGVFNQILLKLQFIHKPILWLSDEKIAMLSLIITNTWKAVPFWIIMLLAGLKNVPEELSEAATIDGANFAQVLRYIKIPQLKPVIKSVSVLSIIWTLNYFDLIYVLTNGGPGVSTSTMSIFIYRLGFQTYKFGQSAAMSMIALFVLMVLVIPYIKSMLKEM